MHKLFAIFLLLYSFAVFAQDTIPQIKCGKVSLPGIYEAAASKHSSSALIAFTPSATAEFYDILQLSTKEIVGAKTIKGNNGKSYWIQATGLPFLNDILPELSLKYAKLDQKEIGDDSFCAISTSAVPAANSRFVVMLIFLDVDAKGNFKAMLGAHEEADQEKFQFNKVADLKSLQDFGEWTR
jgi:hypothetical protein